MNNIKGFQVSPMHKHTPHPIILASCEYSTPYHLHHSQALSNNSKLSMQLHMFHKFTKQYNSSTQISRRHILHIIHLTHVYAFFRHDSTCMWYHWMSEVILLIDPSTYLCISLHIGLMYAWMPSIDSIMHNTNLLYIFSTYL